MDLFRSSEALKGLKAFTVFSSGLYAGSVLYVSTVDHDTRKATIKVVSPEAAMTNFKMTHDRIEKIVVRVIKFILQFLLKDLHRNC